MEKENLLNYRNNLKLFFIEKFDALSPVNRIKICEEIDRIDKLLNTYNVYTLRLK